MAENADDVATGPAPLTAPDDPCAQLKGGGKHMRHVTLTSGQSLPAPEIRQLLGRAWPDGLVRGPGRHGSKRR